MVKHTTTYSLDTGDDDDDLGVRPHDTCGPASLLAQLDANTLCTPSLRGLARGHEIHAKLESIGIREHVPRRESETIQARFSREMKTRTEEYDDAEIAFRDAWLSSARYDVAVDALVLSTCSPMTPEDHREYQAISIKMQSTRTLMASTDPALLPKPIPVLGTDSRTADQRRERGSGPIPWTIDAFDQLVLGAPAGTPADLRESARIVARFNELKKRGMPANPLKPGQKRVGNPCVSRAVVTLVMLVADTKRVKPPRIVDDVAALLNLAGAPVGDTRAVPEPAQPWTGARVLKRYRSALTAGVEPLDLPR